MNDDDVDALIGLGLLEKVGPSRLRWLLDGRAPAEAWERLRSGEPPAGEPPPGTDRSRWAAWSDQATLVDGADTRRRLQELGGWLLHPGAEPWPFDGDPEPPAVLYGRGDRHLIGRRPAVAVVGSRRCTAVGRSVAHELGSALAEAGVTVVSGLALGIDAAAHQGALEAGGRPVAVVASALDRPYPKRNRPLWDEVARAGAVVTEAPLGVPTDRWRFPSRNRLIAALADVSVVVESHPKGGALYTVAAALERDRLVMAVPGSVRSSASAGTNQLLVEGAAVARDPADVLAMVGLGVGGASSAPPLFDEDPTLALVRQELAVGPVAIDTIVGRTGRPAGEVAAELDRLVDQGRLVVRGAYLVAIHDG